MRLKKVALVLSAIAVAVTGAVAPQANAVRGGHDVSPDDKNAQNIVIIGGCTGTAISPHWVLAAKHCFREGKHPMPITAGIDKKGGRKGSQETFYAPSGDISLVRMSMYSAFDFDSYPQLASESPQAGQTGTFYGWDNRAHNYLQQSTAQVQGSYQDGSYTNGKMFVVHHQDGAYSKPGDSGGPLFIDGKLAGVASAISGNGVPLNLADIAAQKEWIAEKLATTGDTANF